MLSELLLILANIEIFDEWTPSQWSELQRPATTRGRSSEQIVAPVRHASGMR